MGGGISNVLYVAKHQNSGTYVVTGMLGYMKTFDGEFEQVQDYGRIDDGCVGVINEL